MERNKLNVQYQGRPCYDIVLECGFKKLGENIRNFESANRKICIVTDSTVGHFYAEQIQTELSDYASKVAVFTFPYDSTFTFSFPNMGINNFSKASVWNPQ